MKVLHFPIATPIALVNIFIELINLLKVIRILKILAD